MGGSAFPGRRGILPCFIKSNSPPITRGPTNVLYPRPEKEAARSVLPRDVLITANVKCTLILDIPKCGKTGV